MSILYLALVQLTEHRGLALPVSLGVLLADVWMLYTRDAVGIGVVAILIVVLWAILASLFGRLRKNDWVNLRAMGVGKREIASIVILQILTISVLAGAGAILITWGGGINTGAMSPWGLAGLSVVSPVIGSLLPAWKAAALDLAFELKRK